MSAFSRENLEFLRLESAYEMAAGDDLTLLLRDIDDIKTNVRLLTQSLERARQDLGLRIDQTAVPINLELQGLRDRVTRLEVRYSALGMIVSIAVIIGAAIGALAEWIVPHLFGSK